MAGLRSQAIGPAARSWLTGVAGPRSRKRGPHLVAERRMWSAGRRLPPIARRKGTPSQSVPPGGLADHPPGVSHTPASAGAPLPSRERRIGSAMRACPGPTQEYGRRSAGLPAGAPAKMGCSKCESVKRARFRVPDGVQHERAEVAHRRSWTATHREGPGSVMHASRPLRVTPHCARDTRSRFVFPCARSGWGELLSKQNSPRPLAVARDPQGRVKKRRPAPTRPTMRNRVTRCARAVPPIKSTFLTARTIAAVVHVTRIRYKDTNEVFQGSKR
jgi:hypothetical protein